MGVCSWLIILSCLGLIRCQGSTWDHYLKQIDKAVKQYVDCKTENCSCHESVIDRDLDIWKNGINYDVFLKAKEKGVHYQIINHKLYREKDCMFPFRCKGVEHFILEIIHDLPDMEFILNSRDWPQTVTHGTKLPIFSFSKEENRNWDILYPAWTFWEGGPAISLYPRGIGRWDQHRQSITQAAKKWPWEKKKNKGFFRGSRTSAKRDPLILLSRESPDLVEAEYTKNQAWKSDKDTLGYPPAKEVSFEDHCPYKYLFNFRGVAASFRFKHLFLCESVVFHVGYDHVEFFYPAMKPWVHYIPVEDNLNNVKKLLEFARENDEVVREIAERGRQFIWDHLRMEDISCYWEKLLTKYSKLLKFDVERNDSYGEILPPKVKTEL